MYIFIDNWVTFERGTIRLYVFIDNTENRTPKLLTLR